VKLFDDCWVQGPDVTVNCCLWLPSSDDEMAIML